MGSILELAKRDSRRIVNSLGFEEDLIITPTGLDAVTIQGLTTRHSNGYDTDGRPIISENIHCTFSEKDLNDLGVTTRISGKLTIKNWTVQFNDAIQTGIVYKISEAYPDLTLGLIRCTLTQYE